VRGELEPVRQNGLLHEADLRPSRLVSQVHAHHAQASRGAIRIHAMLIEVDGFTDRASNSAPARQETSASARSIATSAWGNTRAPRKGYISRSRGASGRIVQ